MASFPYRSALFSIAIAAPIWAVLTSCRVSQAGRDPTIEFTRIPPAETGSPEKLERIEGRVKGSLSGERIVLFALSGVWWVQPATDNPFTAVQSDSTWKGHTHPGVKYAALLVDSHYRPPLTISSVPGTGGHILAAAIVPGAAPESPPKILRFSGYQWEARQNANDPEGAPYNPGNVWTDDHGFMHLRIARQNDRWMSAEVKLSRSLGYGSYRFVVHDVSYFEPAAVFAIFTWDDLGPSREMDIEISRWGEPEEKNAQYVIQPYVVPANTMRFAAPAGPLTYWMVWEPGRVTFKTVRGAQSSNGSAVVAEHVFTSGVPSAGNERIHMNLWVYSSKRHPLQHEFEVVVEKFEFLP
jgi:hypothetical protein